MDGTVMDWGQSESVGKLAEAMAAIQGEIEDPRRDSQNPHFRNSFASLEQVVACIRAVASRHGVWVDMTPCGGGDGSLEMLLSLTHTSGEYRWTRSRWPVAKNDPQGFGSAESYARRYTLKSAFMLAEVDDDGQRAAQGPSKRERDDAAKVMRDELPDCTTGDDLRGWWMRAGNMDAAYGLKEAFSSHVKKLGYQPKAAATKGELVPLDGDKAAA